jgi:hypothetical protein
MAKPFYARLEGKGRHLADEQKIQCHDCGGTELYNTVLSARNGVIIGRKARTGDEWILVRCFVCLSCGFVMPYLDSTGVERLRVWASEAELPPDYLAAQVESNPPPVDTASRPATAEGGNPAAQEDRGRGFGTIVIMCFILGALLGILGAIYGFTHD